MYVSDASGQDLGRVQIETNEDGRLFGTFEPGSEYPGVEPIFRHFADVVEQHAFSYLDAAEDAIARLGITIQFDGQSQAHPAKDVQIYPEGEFSCRSLRGVESNGTAH